MSNIQYSMKSGKIDLSIVIVYYKGFNGLLELLDSIKKNRIKNKYEIIVVNNKPSEDIGSKLKRKFKDLIYVKSPGNIGYGKGNNLGVEHARGKYVFIANPDTKIVKGSVDKLANFLAKNNKTGIIAPNLVDKKGRLFEKQGTRLLTPIRAIFSLTILSRIFPDNKFFRSYYMFDIPKRNFREVSVVPGSAFVIKKNIFTRLSGFDNNFFLFFEEMDLCKRLHDIGYKSYMTPKLVMQHDWVEKEGGIRFKKVFNESRYYYFKKHYGVVWAIIVEFVARLSKENLLLLALLILVLWLI